MNTNILIGDLIDAIDSSWKNFREVENFLESIGIKLIKHWPYQPCDYTGYTLKKGDYIFRLRYRGGNKYGGDYAYMDEVDELTLKDVIEKRMKKED